MGILKAMWFKNLMNHTGDRIVLFLFALKHHNFYGERTVCDLFDKQQFNFHFFLCYLCYASKFINDYGRSIL